LGAIRSVTISLMVFSTSLSPVLFGILIDLGLGSKEIMISMLIYAVFSIFLMLLKIKSYKPTISS